MDLICLQVYCCSTCQPLQLDIASGTAAAAAAAEAGKQSKSRKRPDSKSSKQDSTAAAGAAAGADAAAAAKQLLSPSRLKSMAAAQVAKVGMRLHQLTAADVVVCMCICPLRDVDTHWQLLQVPKPS